MIRVAGSLRTAAPPVKPRATTPVAVQHPQFGLFTASLDKLLRQKAAMLIDAVMEPERINRAMDRIAAAAERISASTRSAGGSAARTDAAHADLEQRHQRLRQDTAAALEELDQLLLALEQ
jgi:hypothetical protein